MRIDDIRTELIVAFRDFANAPPRKWVDRATWSSGLAHPCFIFIYLFKYFLNRLFVTETRVC
jgi:hypothetical protein